MGIKNNLKIHCSAHMSGCISSVRDFFGVNIWSRDFFGFCFLPPYDHPRHLKSGVPPCAPKSQAMHICT